MYAERRTRLRQRAEEGNVNGNSFNAKVAKELLAKGAEKNKDVGVSSQFSRTVIEALSAKNQ